MGLLIVRLVELLIVIVPLIGVLFAGFKAVSKVRERQDEAPSVEAPQQRKDQQISTVAGDRAHDEGA